MRLYVAVAENMAWDRHVEVREEHFAYLEQLQGAGSLVAAGLFGDESGGLFILAAPTLEEATRLAADDPYYREGVRSLRVVEWKLTRLLHWHVPLLKGIDS